MYVQSQTARHLVQMCEMSAAVYACCGCLEAAMDDLVRIDWRTTRDERHERYMRGVRDLIFGNSCCLFIVLHIFFFFAVYRDHDFVRNFPLQRDHANQPEPASFAEKTGQDEAGPAPKKMLKSPL